VEITTPTAALLGLRDYRKTEEAFCQMVNDHGDVVVVRKKSFRSMMATTGIPSIERDRLVEKEWKGAYGRSNGTDALRIFRTQTVGCTANLCKRVEPTSCHHESFLGYEWPPVSSQRLTFTNAYILQSKGRKNWSEFSKRRSGKEISGGRERCADQAGPLR